MRVRLAHLRPFVARSVIINYHHRALIPKKHHTSRRNLPCLSIRPARNPSAELPQALARQAALSSTGYGAMERAPHRDAQALQVAPRLIETICITTVARHHTITATVLALQT